MITARARDEGGAKLMGVQSREKWERFGAMRSDSVGFLGVRVSGSRNLCSVTHGCVLLSRVRAVLALDA